MAMAAGMGGGGGDLLQDLLQELDQRNAEIGRLERAVSAAEGERRDAVEGLRRAVERASMQSDVEKSWEDTRKTLLAQLSACDEQLMRCRAEHDGTLKKLDTCYDELRSLQAILHVKEPLPRKRAREEMAAEPFVFERGVPSSAPAAMLFPISAAEARKRAEAKVAVLPEKPEVIEVESSEEEEPTTHGLEEMPESMEEVPLVRHHEAATAPNVEAGHPLTVSKLLEQHKSAPPTLLLPAEEKKTHTAFFESTSVPEMYAHVMRGVAGEEAGGEEYEILQAAEYSNVADLVSKHVYARPEYKSFVFVVGSGASAEVGIPVFRDPENVLAGQIVHAAQAAWREHNPHPRPNDIVKHGDYEEAYKDRAARPELLTRIMGAKTRRRWSYEIRAVWKLLVGVMMNKPPATAHLVMRMIYDRGRLGAVYSMNIDGLEVAAGIPASSMVLSHGSVFAGCRNSLAQCRGCVGVRKPEDITDDMDMGVVLFGEDAYMNDATEAAFAEAAKNACLVVVGVSGSVLADWIADLQYGRLVIVNPDEKAVASLMEKFGVVDRDAVLRFRSSAEFADVFVPGWRDSQPPNDLHMNNDKEVVDVLTRICENWNMAEGEGAGGGSGSSSSTSSSSSASSAAKT
jgi:NAD-dependent SIR2 family protein deacetylase